MRLLEWDNANGFRLTPHFKDEEVPRYAILSHTWGPDTEEVTFRDISDGKGKDKEGYEKIQFCGEQARRDGLQYFWVDTCCIDKSDNTELSESINSMFRWYRDAAICYVYLSDIPRSVVDNNGQSIQLPWESAFRQSRWFKRGWTLQELIAPKSVEFFDKNRQLLGTKESLERYIREITRIPTKALQESNSLSHFTVTERFAWANTRETSRKEDEAYSLLGIFGIYMPLIYGEGRDHAFKRLREEIEKLLKGKLFHMLLAVIKNEPHFIIVKFLTRTGTKHEKFTVTSSLVTLSGVDRFVARENELAEIHSNLSSDGSRRIVVLQGLGGIGKTQLSIAYAKRYKGNYSAIFWLNINDEDSIKQSYVSIAKHILREHPSADQLNGIDMQNADHVIEAVKTWLCLPNNTRWLMIYDNYDNPKTKNNADPTAIDIRQYLPESDQGSVIITTRSSEVRVGKYIRIQKLKDVQDCLRILSNTSNRRGLENGMLFMYFFGPTLIFCRSRCSQTCPQARRTASWASYCWSIS